MGPTTRWMESSVVCSVLEFFFSKGIFYPRPEAFVSGRLSHFSAQRLSEMTEIWEQFLMLTRSREAALRTIHQSLRQSPRWAEETREPHSETWKAIFSEGTEKRRGAEERERERKGTGQMVTTKFTPLVFSWNQRNFLSPSWECAEERSWLEAKIVLILRA